MDPVLGVSYLMIYCGDILAYTENGKYNFTRYLKLTANGKLLQQTSFLFILESLE